MYASTIRPIAVRSSRITASLLAVLLAVLVGAPKDPDVAANHHSRTPRIGTQRLESGDVVDHSFEDEHPVLDAASDDAQLKSYGKIDAPPGAVLPALAARLEPPSSSTLLLSPPVHTRTLAQPHRPDLGRAPPLHS